MKKTIFFLSLLTVFSLLQGCSLLSPKAKIEITLVGEKTSLENQVLGNYGFIGADPLMLVSVRALPDDISLISDEKKRSFLAYQNRLYNKDDYQRFMDMKIIGENNSGYVEVRDTQRLERDKELDRLISRFIDEENRDRRIIYKRIISVTEGLTENDISKVEEIFAHKMQDEAKTGWYVQDASGLWREKSAP
ncbi:MAG TPA: DUF1318 domain-containing protein [Firmicutes bacterium]|jgi:uncharacterized protein YdbL (DUF1318 family)|nr:DUF1318 domain-containing protein [Bacillota bacterium]